MTSLDIEYYTCYLMSGRSVNVLHAGPIIIKDTYPSLFNIYSVFYIIEGEVLIHTSNEIKR